MRLVISTPGTYTVSREDPPSYGLRLSNRTFFRLYGITYGDWVRL